MHLQNIIIDNIALKTRNKVVHGRIIKNVSLIKQEK